MDHDPETWEERLDAAMTNALRRREKLKERKDAARQRIQQVLMPALDTFCSRLERTHRLQIYRMDHSSRWGVSLPGPRIECTCVWTVRNEGSFCVTTVIGNQRHEKSTWTLQPYHIYEVLTSWLERVLETLCETDSEGDLKIVSQKDQSAAEGVVST